MPILFDQEAKGNLSPDSGQEAGRVIPLFATDMEDELLVLARSVRVEREEVFEDEEEDFGPDLAVIDGEGQEVNEDKIAALKLLVAAGIVGAVAIGEAIARGPLPF